MNGFTLHLQSAAKSEKIEHVVSFVGEDASGSFGILSGHARIMTALKFGLARIKFSNHQKEYIALSGGILYFVDNLLRIATRHYLRSDNYQAVIIELDKQRQTEKTTLSNLKETLHRLDENILKRLWELQREGKYESK